MNKYNDKIMKAVRQSLGLDKDDESTDEEIMRMNRKQVFELYCQWNGVLGSWYNTLLEVVKNIYDVELKERD